jgi:peroxiredoxin
MERTATSTRFPLGSLLPTFSLPATDGQHYGSDYLKSVPASLVVFTCNHCPYVKGSEAQVYSLIRQYSELGLKSLLISANDAAQYPDDSFEKMKEKFLSAQLPCPYLYDETQEVARLFDAQCTPEVFLFDASAKLVYQGAVNDSPRDASQVRHCSLELALQQVCAGQRVTPDFVHPIGCSIKWKN